MSDVATTAALELRRVLAASLDGMGWDRKFFSFSSYFRETTEDFFCFFKIASPKRLPLKGVSGADWVQMGCLKVCKM